MADWRGTILLGVAAILFTGCSDLGYDDSIGRADDVVALTERNDTATDRRSDPSVPIPPPAAPPDRTADAEPAETLPDRTADAEPAETLPDRTADAEPAETLPDRTADAEPAESLPDRTADAEPAESLPDTEPVEPPDFLPESAQTPDYVFHTAYVWSDENRRDLGQGVRARWAVRVGEPSVLYDRSACNGTEPRMQCVYFPMMNFWMDDHDTAIHIGPQMANSFGWDDRFGSNWLINYGYYLGEEGFPRQWGGSVPTGEWIVFDFSKESETPQDDGWVSTWSVRAETDQTELFLGTVELPARHFSMAAAALESIEFDGEPCESDAPDVDFRLMGFEVENADGSREWTEAQGVQATYSPDASDSVACENDAWVRGDEAGVFSIRRSDDDLGEETIVNGEWIWRPES